MKNILFALFFCIQVSALFSQEGNEQKADSQNVLKALPGDDEGGGGGGGSNFISVEAYSIQVLNSTTIRLVNLVLATNYGSTTVFTCSLRINNVTQTTTGTASQLGAGKDFSASAFNLTAFNTYSTQVTVNYSSTSSGTDDSGYSFLFAIPEPSAQATNISFNSITTSSMNVAWTAAGGSPAGYIVLRSTAWPNTNPSDGVAYSAGNTIGNATVAYVGSGTSFASTGLSAGTTYYYYVYSYNGSGSFTNYRIASPLSGSQSTMAAEPAAQPTNLNFTLVTPTSMTVNWTATSASGYLVLRRTGAAPTGVPADGASYSVGNAIGDGTVAYVGSGTSFNLSGLTQNTTYYFTVFAYNGSGATINYRTASPLSGNKTTPLPLAASPTVQPINISFPVISENTIRVQWEYSSTCDGFIVLRKNTSPSSSNPVDGVTYSAGQTLGDAIVVNTAGTIAYSADTVYALEPGQGYPSFFVTAAGLSADTKYGFSVFAFNGTVSGTENYLTTTPLTGTAWTLAVQPSAQPTGLVFSSVNPSGMTLNWTAASGPPTGYLIIRRAGAAPTGVPDDGATYAAGSTIGDGTVAYFGTSTTFTESSLSANTVYYYAIYSYNGANSNYNYLTTSPLQGNRSTMAAEPTAQPTAIGFTSVTNNSMSVNWTAANPAPGGYIVVRTTSTSSDPVDGTTYSVGQALGSGNVAYIGSGTSFNASGLAAGTVHTFKVYSYAGSGAEINYRQVSPLTGSRTTLSNEPSGQASNLQFSSVASSSMTLNWTAATGATGYLILRRANIAPSGTPADGAEYSGTFNGSNVHISTTNSITITGLTSSTVYHYVIYAYNGSGQTINYNTASPAASNRSTLIEPPGAPTSLAFYNIGSSQMTLEWVPPSPEPAGYLVLRRAGSAPGAPLGGTTYAEGQTLPDGQTVVDFSGSAINYAPDTTGKRGVEPCEPECPGGGSLEVSIVSTGLNPSTTYYYAIYAYDGSGGSTSYSAALTGSQTTLQAPPEPVGTVSLEPLSESSVRLSWENNPVGSGYLVVGGTGWLTSPLPGVVYQPGPGLGGWIYSVGTATSCIASNLTASSNYKFTVYSYNGSGTTTNYSTASQVTWTTPDRHNQIVSMTFLRPGVLESHIDTLDDRFIQYSKAFSDGMGRLTQTLSRRASPLKKDIVTPVVYDIYGRTSTSYLPYVAAYGDGAFKSGAVAAQLAFYQSGLSGIPYSTKPFSFTKYENSPLNRILEQGAPGETWQPNANDFDGRTVKTWQSGNVTNSVRLWKTDGTGTGFYSPNEIVVTETIDENGNSSYTYTDKSERSVMKKSKKGTTEVVTYYVYDDFGNLKFIIPPMAADAMQSSGVWDINQNGVKSKWVTEFWYDSENRLIEKKIPEADPIYTIYDKLGRVVLTQDGLLRQQNSWMFTKYDILGRAVITGVYAHGSSVTRQAMQDLVLLDPDVYEIREASEHGYSTNRVFPTSNLDIWTVTYYDDYNFDYDTGGTDDYTFTSDPDFSMNVKFDRLKGKVTGTKTKILDLPARYAYANGRELIADASTALSAGSGEPLLIKDQNLNSSGTIVSKEITLEGEVTLNGEMVLEAKADATNGMADSRQLTADGSNSHSYSASLNGVTWLVSASFYDKYGRVIQTQSNNSLGGTDISHTEYDFPGKVLKTKTVHQTSAGTVTVRKRFDYDHVGRLVKTYQQNNTDSEIMLAQNSYNELGTLVEKKLHSTNGGSSALQTVNYAYNIRGWLTSVNDPNSLGSDLFAMKLNYESVDANIAGTTQYNGNISQQIWATSTAARHAYGYSYDQLNQLSIAEYEKYAGSWNQDAGRFNESATYDLNGNIMTMTRGGKVDWSANTYGTMDNLSMTYNGNKLIGSNDAVADIANNQKYDFSDQGMEAAIDVNNASTHEYLYDVNGNMIEDKNKHMTVAYNFLNLPTQVDFGSGNKIEWAYTVSGAKLRKTVYTNGTVTLTQDYVSGFVYKNGSLDFFSTETGRVKNQSGSLKYQYTLSDHLGNTRVMFADTNNNGSPEIIEESHYYAFGMRIEGLSTTNPDNKFTYNGKELEDDHGLNWYHYGARYYDPQIGRWWVIDPADEFYSPYTYGPNNPVNGADPNGMWWEELWNWVRFGAWKDNETIGRWERLATTFDPENYDESMLETGFLDYYDKRQHELATIELMTGQASEFDPLAGSDPETLRSMNRGTDIGYYSIAYARWKYHNQIHSAVVGGVAGGIRGASPGMKALFEGGTVEGKSIIGIRETLLKNGFKFEGLSRDKKAYLFTFGKESVRIRPMGNDTWEILMQNAVGNRLDKYGNVSTGMGPAHGIRVYSK